MHRYPGLQCLAQTERLLAPDLARHEDSVGTLAAFLSEKLGMGGFFALNIKTAARFHDIGKLTVPEAILIKAGRLKPAEWDTVKKHPAAGLTILAGTSDAILDLAAMVALSHHEKYDGTGYPRGLKGDDIPLPARIVALCDVYDALRADRVYRPGVDHLTAMRAMTIGDGRTGPTHFDPQILGAFQANEAEFSRLFDAAEAGYPAPVS